MRMIVRIGFFLAAVAASQGLSGQEPAAEQLRITKALHFDCGLTSEKEVTKPIALEVLYVMYADDPNYQVNFKDSTGALFGRSGWAPKGHFALARTIEDGRLFVWLGKREEGLPPQIDTTVQVTPTSDRPGLANIIILRFRDDDRSEATAESFGGSCKVLTGKAAWDASQR